MQNKNLYINWSKALHKNIYLDYEANLNTVIPLDSEQFNTSFATVLLEQYQNY
jgi:hypothetical protein